MNRTRSRLLAFSISLVVCLLLVGAFFLLRPAPSIVSFHEPEFPPPEERISEEYVPSTESGLVRNLALVDERGIESIDLRESPRQTEGLLYWFADSHINLRAHESIAQTLLPYLEREL